jgi:hypothetical protein
MLQPSQKAGRSTGEVSGIGFQHEESRRELATGVEKTQMGSKGYRGVSKLDHVKFHAIEYVPWADIEVNILSPFQKHS